MPTLKAIQAEFEAFKRRQRWWQIGFIVAVVVLVVLLVTVFRSKGKPDESYRLQVEAMDSTIKAHERNLQLLSRFTLMLDSTDLQLQEKLKANRPKETVIIKQYEKVPTDVYSLDREGIRSEVTKFK